MEEWGSWKVGGLEDWRIGPAYCRDCCLDIWKTEIVLRRSKIFIVIGIRIALSSVGAAYYGQHLHTDLHPYRFRGAGFCSNLL